MPELGTKHECPNCGVKFYDLGKPEPICPRCEANANEPAEGDQDADKPAAGAKAKKPKKAKKAKKPAAKETAAAAEAADG